MRGFDADALDVGLDGGIKRIPSGRFPVGLAQLEADVRIE